MQKRVKRIVSGRGKKPARARRRYKEILSGARQQQRFQRIYERHFLDQKFESRQLVEKAAKFKGSRRQRIELGEYAKRLAKKRNWALQRFKAWGIKPEHMGKPMEKTPSGASAKKILYNLVGWHNIEAKVEMVPTIDLIGFSVGHRAYSDILRKEHSKTQAAEIYLFPRYGKAMGVLVSPNLEKIKKYWTHEKQHSRTARTPLMQELHKSKKKSLNTRTLRQAFVATDLKTGGRRIGREMLDELIANMVEKDLGYFEKKYRTYYLPDSSREFLGQKTATAFMHNKGKHKSKLLKATAESIKAVRNALAATVTDSQGRKRKIVSRKELAGLLANIRDIGKVPKRLPVLIELRKKALQKRLASK